MRKVAGAAVLLVALGGRLFVALATPAHAGGDASEYAQIATNLLQRHIYSSDDEAPIRPTYDRVPGYPLFVAAFGVNERAVRVVQAVVDTGTCLLAALIAVCWGGERAFFPALILAAVCPFTAMWVGWMLTESLATFLVTAMVLAVVRDHLALAGLLGGIATMVRLECIGFVAVVAVFLLFTAPDPVDDPLPLAGEGAAKRRVRVTRKRVWILIATFVPVLVPWTVRNARVFGIFEPLAPIHATMPDEYFPAGYTRWVQTWVDDFKWVPPFEWAIEHETIDVNAAPPSAFDSPDERQRVAALFDQYNDEGEMTPELDRQFARIASERIAHSPLRFYALLPLKRATSIWSGFRWIYLLAGLAGAIALPRSTWAPLVALLIVPRLIVLATLPNPEPRYTTEFFPILTAAAAVALSDKRADPLSG